MISHINARFRKAFKQLPAHVQQQARKNYKLWKKDPWSDSLQFKQVHPTRLIYSVRIGKDWRAVGLRLNDHEILWYWIGSHEEYNRLLSQLRKS